MMNKNQRHKSFADNVLLTLGTKILLFVVGILNSILTARVLGPHDRGLASLLFNMTTTIDNFSRLGISPANIYMIGHEKAEISDVATNSLFFAFILGVFGIIIVLLCKNFILPLFLWNAPQLYLILAISMVPLHILDEYLIAVFLATNQFGIANLRVILSRMLTLISFFVVLVVMNGGLIGILIASLLISGFISFFMIWTIRNCYNFAYKFNLILAKKTISYGLKSYCQTMTSYFHLKLDLYLLAIFLGPEQIAFYTIGTRMAELILIVPSTLASVLFPKLTSVRDVGEKNTLTSMLIRQMFLLLGLFTVMFWLIGKSLIGIWYGQDYLPAATPFKIILPGVAMMAIYSIISRYFMSENKQRLTIISGSIALGVNLILNLLLIPKLGMNGAAIASTISYTLAAAFLLKFFLIESKQGILDVIHFRRQEIYIYENIFTHLLLMIRRTIRIDI